jgi:hypothetical protein
MNRRIQLTIVTCMLMLAVGLSVRYIKPTSAKSAAFEWKIANAIDNTAGEAAPVTILKINQNGKALKFGEAFSAPAEALTNASVVVHNTTNKWVKDLSVALMLVDPNTNRPRAMTPSLQFNGGITAYGEATGTISDKIIKSVQELSKHTGIPLTQIRLGISYVEFTDSTRWMHGMTLLEDQERPGKWYVKGYYDVYLEALKRSQKNDGAAYNSISTQPFCAYLAWVDTNIPCDGGCKTFQENFTSIPNAPTPSLFDFVYVQCTPPPACYSSPLRITGGC